MTYNTIGTYGSVAFKVGDVEETEQQSTLKVKLGKKFIEKEIPLKDTKDIVLNINGIITGLSRTAAQTLAEAIAVDRTALRLLEDGDWHAYDDGENSGNFAIVSRSLSIPDAADVAPGQPVRFSMTLVEWK